MDVVYNPDKTELILRAEEAGVPVAGSGLEMLVAQAVYAAEYFLDRKFEDVPAEIRRITAALRRDTLNIAPHRHAFFRQDHAGQTAGKAAGPHLRGSGRRDRQGPTGAASRTSLPPRARTASVQKRPSRPPASARRTASCCPAAAGVVKRPENLRALHQNGVVLFIDRPVEALAVGGSRPLSSSMEALRTMEAQRRPLYRAAADAVVPNTGTLEDALRAAMEALDEIFDS